MGPRSRATQHRWHYYRSRSQPYGWGLLWWIWLKSIFVTIILLVGSANAQVSQVVTLTWDYTTTAQTTGFTIERQPQGGSFGLVGTATPVERTATDTISGNAGDTFIYRMAAYEGTNVSGYSNTAAISIAGAVGNTAPLVNAGPDATILLSSAISLNGSVADDGLPSGNLVWNWSKVGGPGNGKVTFDNPNASQTFATFSRTGTYTLRLSASDGSLTASDDVVVTVRRK